MQVMTMYILVEKEGGGRERRGEAKRGWARERREEGEGERERMDIIWIGLRKEGPQNSTLELCVKEVYRL